MLSDRLGAASLAASLTDLLASICDVVNLAWMTPTPTDVQTVLDTLLTAANFSNLVLALGILAAGSGHCGQTTLVWRHDRAGHRRLPKITS